MGRLICVENEIEQSINKMRQLKMQVGLIVGQFTPTKDFALHFVRCPEPVEEELEAEDSDSTEKINKKSTNKSADTEIDVKWIVEHARQVNRMLPGGLNVIGTYVYCDLESLNKYQPKLKQCFTSIYKRMEKNALINQSFPHKERYFIHIDSNSNKTMCRTFDASEEIINFKPAELKYQPFLDSWCSLSTKVELDIQIAIPIKHETTSLDKKFIFAFQREINDIWNAYAVAGTTIIDEAQSLIENKKTNKKTNKIKTFVNENIEVDFFKKKNSENNAKELSTEKIEMSVKFVGSIASKAYVHSKGTYGEGIKFLKIDIIRSILTRIELLCEEAQVNNLAQVDEWSLVSPVRVFVPFTSKSNINFSDYVFKDESENDVINRFADLLDLKVVGDSLEYAEHSPSVAEVSTMLHLVGDKQSDVNSDVASEISSSCNEEHGNKKMFLTGGVMAGVAAIAYSFVRLFYTE